MEVWSRAARLPGNPMPAPAPAPEASPVAAEPSTASTVQSLNAPSVRTVGGVLLGGRMTAMQIRNASGLPRRTVYSALKALRKEGLLQERRSLKDSRQSYFWLVAAATPPASNLEPGALAMGETADGPATLAL